MLPRPMNLSVEVDGNLADPLFVFANPELAPPDKNDPKVRFTKPAGSTTRARSC